MRLRFKQTGDYLARNAMVFAVACLALAVRLLIIYTRPHGGGYDLQIYRYFADIILQGGNPYQAPVDGPIHPTYADMSPCNLGIFAAALSLRDSPLSLRVLFATVDFAILLLVGLAGCGCPWRKALLLFYAFNPLVLTSFVFISEDKPILFAGLLLVVLAVERSRAFGAVLAATFLSIYKWLGGFFMLPLVFYFSKRWRDVFLYLSLFFLLFALSHLPYFPDDLLAYRYRSARTEINPPIHASITTLLSLAGWYHPLFFKAATLAALATIHLLFFLRRIGLQESIVLTVFFACIFAPEIGYDRLLLITLPFFFIVDLPRHRLATVWLSTLLAAVALAVNYSGYPVALQRVPFLGMASQSLFGRYASVQHVLRMNLLPGLMLGYYLKDKLTGRTRGDDKFIAFPEAA